MIQATEAGLTVRQADVSSYVARRSLQPADLARSLRQLILVEGLPLIAGVAAALVLWQLAPVLSLLALAGALVWMIYTTSGRPVAYGLYDQGQLVGGLRTKVRGRRQLLIGLYVEHGYRRRGGAALLVAAALNEARELIGDGGEVVAYAPTHPGSRRLVDHHFGGRKLVVGSAEFERARQRLAK